MTQDLSAVDWPVHTERLVLRPATAEDIEAIWQIRRIPSVAEWMTAASGELEEFQTQFAEPARLDRTLALELEGELIGDLMIMIDSPWSQAEVTEQAKDTQAELGWVVSPDHAGRGYATEAARALIRICFEDLGLRRVYAQCFAANEASWRIMEKLGMRREEYAVRESLHRSGEWLDGMRYALLADEWEPGSGGQG